MGGQLSAMGEGQGVRRGLVVADLRNHSQIFTLRREPNPGRSLLWGGLNKHMSVGEAGREGV